MALLEEVETTPAPEKIPFFIKKAIEGFDWNKPIKFSLAGALLSTVPLNVYLPLRLSILESARDHITRTRDWREAAGIYSDDIEKMNNRLHNLKDELNLTHAVAVAAGIKIDA